MVTAGYKYAVGVGVFTPISARDRGSERIQAVPRPVLSYIEHRYCRNLIHPDSFPLTFWRKSQGDEVPSHRDRRVDHIF